MNPILATSLVSAGQSLLSQAIDAGSSAQSDDPSFSKVLNSKMLDTAKYMEDNGLHSTEDVAKHIEELKAQLLQTPQFLNTPYGHEEPSNIEIQRNRSSYSLSSPQHKTSIPPNTQAHHIAHTIHSLQQWVDQNT
jgi:hypothetical protein